ncbi:MAG: hypothetical protein N2509_09275, partial [Treponemataceae bacterium]|nr:hypothetical protein [Treponemataceae bacterium]
MNRKVFEWLDERLRDSIHRMERLDGIDSVDAFVVGCVTHLTFLRVLWKYSERAVLEVLRGLGAEPRQYVSALQSVSDSIDEFDWFILSLSRQFRKSNRLTILASLYEYLSSVIERLDRRVGFREFTVWDIVRLICEYNDS